MTVTVRIQTRERGYLLIRVDGAETETGRRRYVAVHRLAGVAWGELSGLDDPREIDHCDRSTWHNAEANIDARDPREHGRVTREREQTQRRTTA